MLSSFTFGFYTKLLSLGFEPRWHYAEDFKSPVYTYSTTRAKLSQQDSNLQPSD